jgi:antitoxin VapB
MTTAKLFQNGQSQAVRLPKEFRFDDQKEVFIKKIGNMVVLIPRDDRSAWSGLFESLGEFSEDFMAERTPEPVQVREEMF